MTLKTNRAWTVARGDLPNAGDQDYNDMIVEIHAVMIPLPSQAVIAASGLMGIFGVVRHRRGRA